MAHPTIDITQQPDEDCFHPAYNCIKYCFTCNDFLVAIGTKAQFTAEINPAIIGGGYVAGASVITLAGQAFASSTQTTYNEMLTDGLFSKQQFSENIEASCIANTYLFENFSFSIVAEVLTAIAREEGEFDDYVFSHLDNVGNPIPFPMIFSSTNGSDPVYRDNYRLIIEIWECQQGVQTRRISKESYIPDANGDFCINIGEKVAPLLETTFVHKEKILNGLNSNWFYDFSISKEICLRYGELYSDDVDECNTQLRTFALTTSIVAVNSAFQREEQEDKYVQLCNDEFMTSMPDFAEFCDESLIFLWINLGAILALLDNPNKKAHPYYEFTYTDGTVDKRIGSQFIPSPLQENDDFFAVGVGIPTVSAILIPSKQLHSWRARIVIRENSDPNTDQYFADQYFKRISCCDGQIDFYFLNEFGGIDTILMQTVTQIELQQEFAFTESFVDCEKNDAVESGIDTINQEAFDVFTITSRFTNDYETRLWLRQAIMSPKKWIRTTIPGQDSIFYKIIALDTSTIYYNESDNFLFLTLQYRINEDLNLQKN